jgi:hypothetical protein
VLWFALDPGRQARERVLPDLAEVFFVSAPLLPEGQKPDTLPESAFRELIGRVREVSG